MARHDSILELVGSTPVIRINKMAPAGVNLFVKIEAFNPMGSVKDRLALGVIESDAAPCPPARPSSRQPAATPVSGWPWSVPGRDTRWW